MNFIEEIFVSTMDVLDHNYMKLEIELIIFMLCYKSYYRFQCIYFNQKLVIKFSYPSYKLLPHMQAFAVLESLRANGRV